MHTMEEKIMNTGTIRRKTLVAFGVFLLFIAACIFIWRWIHRQPNDNDTPEPLRYVLNNNEKIFSGLFANNHMARSYPLSAAAARVRVNGDAGMSDNFDASTWKLQLVRNAGDTQLITLDDIRALPKTEIIFDFKCIEGWSQVTRWAGVKFSDFAAHYHLDSQTQMKFAGLNTPDKEYYVGIDMASMLHPQTLLCYEMNGQPLPMNQGYPLRLIIPVKYGVKNIKRIGTLFFGNERPPDYWYERGYDYYGGL
ncbi:MAG: molybdopterin-dependent oxidoreductase [Bacteroidetes bacterium]|nr:molybdopterin-dependent oxidoreductase [Bacteroidota bacterium]